MPALLQHGVDARGELVPVEEVGRGRTSLACPYCARGLVARKGRVLAPHFAHDGPTCRASRERAAATLPLYDDFTRLDPLERADLRLCAQLLGHPINHTSLRGWRRAALARLVDAELIEEVPRGQRWVNGLGSHRATKWGTQVVGALRYRLPLREFARAQERAALDKLERLERLAVQAQADAATDLRLYRAQLVRLFSMDLYLVRISAGSQRLHKIGATGRPLAQRLPEIRRDLERRLGDEKLELEVAGHWPRRGPIELYFKQRFRRRQVRIGSLTEYFSFARDRQALRMLERLDLELSPRLIRLLDPAATPDTAS